MHGGYRAFYHEFRHLCAPQYYMEMFDTRFQCLYSATFSNDNFYWHS